MYRVLIIILSVSFAQMSWAAASNISRQAREEKLTMRAERSAAAHNESASPAASSSSDESSSSSVQVQPEESVSAESASSMVSSSSDQGSSSNTYDSATNRLSPEMKDRVREMDEALRVLQLTPKDEECQRYLVRCICNLESSDVPLFLLGIRNNFPGTADAKVDAELVFRVYTAVIAHRSASQVTPQIIVKPAWSIDPRCKKFLIGVGQGALVGSLAVGAYMGYRTYTPYFQMLREWLTKK